MSWSMEIPGDFGHRDSTPRAEKLTTPAFCVLFKTATVCRGGDRPGGRLCCANIFRVRLVQSPMARASRTVSSARIAVLWLAKSARLVTPDRFHRL